MQVLVHLGLNKCASTFIQNALDQSRPILKSAGTWYPDQTGPPCQYGVSKHYGFGPNEPSIVPRSVAALIDEADRNRCDRLILSSEYLSLCRPNAARAFCEDLAKYSRQTRFVIFSREIFGWVRSLFNQYIKAVEGPGQLDDLNAFIDQVLSNRAAHVAERMAMWQGLAPEGSVRHYRLAPEQDRTDVLSIFETFAGLSIEMEAPEIANGSIDAAALHRIGRLRRKLPTPDRDAEIERLSCGGASPYPEPAGFLDISADRRARIIREIVAPYAALPSLTLPEVSQVGSPPPSLQSLELS
ncbi:MAG: hypothetical protein AAF479_09120 [Pseudomonadota bacterium]